MAKLLRLLLIFMIPIGVQAHSTDPIDTKDALEDARKSLLIRMAERGQTPFDNVTFQEFNNQSEALWRTLIKEQGSSENARIYVFKSPVADPRLLELHQNVANFLKTSPFYAENFSGLFEEELPNYLDKPISGLLRFILTNIAVTDLQRLYDVTSLSKRHSLELQRPVVDGLINCALGLRRTDCGDNHETDALNIAREFGVAYLLSFQQPEHICDHSVNNAWILYSLSHVDNYVMRAAYGAKERMQKAIEASAVCFKNSPSSEQERQLFMPLQSLPAISAKYFPVK